MTIVQLLASLYDLGYAWVKSVGDLLMRFECGMSHT